MICIVLTQGSSKALNLIGAELWNFLKQLIIEEVTVEFSTTLQ